MISREEIKDLMRQAMFTWIQRESIYNIERCERLILLAREEAYNRAIDDAAKTCELVPAEWEFPTPLPSPANAALQCADRVRELKNHQRSN